VAGTPEPPSSNRSGGFSLAPAGPGVSRIVVDAGTAATIRRASQRHRRVRAHARRRRAAAAEAARGAAGFAVVLTRSTDDYIALEERTAIANREGADLFLSIHANASRQTSASGIETHS
jgi:N-acetylmuramoyl-L-alanine amidase